MTEYRNTILAAPSLLRLVIPPPKTNARTRAPIASDAAVLETGKIERISATPERYCATSDRNDPEAVEIATSSAVRPPKCPSRNCGRVTSLADRRGAANHTPSTRQAAAQPSENQAADTPHW